MQISTKHIFFIIGLSFPPALQAQCVDSILLQQLQQTFIENPTAFWSNKLEVHAGKKTEFYQRSIQFVGHQLPLLPHPAKDSMHFRIWKWSEWHTGGFVYEMRYTARRWQAIAYFFDEFPGIRIKRRRHVLKINSDSLAARLQRYPLQYLPPQPPHPCKTRETTYTYIIEAWNRGSYRFYYYQDPERYALQGSWADAFLLEALNKLWE